MEEKVKGKYSNKPREKARKNEKIVKRLRGMSGKVKLCVKCIIESSGK